MNMKVTEFIHDFLEGFVKVIIVKFSAYVYVGYQYTFLSFNTQSAEDQTHT